MLVELKRCNSIGDTKGLLFLLRMVAGKESIPIIEASGRCCHEKHVKVRFSAAVAFLDYLGLVSQNTNNIIPTQELKDIILASDEKVISKLSKLCINKLVEDGVFDKSGLSIDPMTGRITIKRNIIPLEYAAIRNFLINTDVFSEYGENLLVSGDIEQEFTKNLRLRNRTITIEQLLRQQQEQNQRGLEGEEFVLKIEQARIPNKKSQIKRVSDIDVAAGYDIISYENEISQFPDRYIEVKTYLGRKLFYWSENEIDVAKLKGEKYYVCLVDYEKIKTPGYLPEFIKNPYSAIFNDDNWLINAATYRIERIGD